MNIMKDRKKVGSFFSPREDREKKFEGTGFSGRSSSYSDRVDAQQVKKRPAHTKSSKGITPTSAKLPSVTPGEVGEEVTLRLNRFISQSGVCSRREADELIAKGLVTVNGEIVKELGVKVLPTDRVELEGKRLQGEKKVYIVMNKPKGYVTSLEDPHNDRVVVDLLKGQIRERVYPVGRLDKWTTGVLLLTNDGDLTKELTHPSFGKQKIYHVFLDKPCTEEDLFKLSEGFELEDGFISADAVSYAGSSRREVGVELHSGRNRIVRRMFEHLGYEVEKLDRVYFAGLTKLGLRRGFWRVLDAKEVSALKGGRYR